VDKVISADGYGICLFSYEVMENFLKINKIRHKLLRDYFQANEDKYSLQLQEGVWLPFVPLNSINYVIKLDGQDEPFSNEWVEKFRYDGFNISIKNGMWIAAIAVFGKYDRTRFLHKDFLSYQMLDGTTLYKAHKYDVPSGKYELSISGFSRKSKLSEPETNYGFRFALVERESFGEYQECQDPRNNEIFNFNVATQ
jgi:hypothetical protein